MENIRKVFAETIFGKLAELIFVALVPLLVIAFGWWLVGTNELARHGVVWCANVLMLLAIWIGLRLRGQTWKHFGLGFQFNGWRNIVRNILRSVVVLVAALGAFILASIPMVNMGFSVQKADMSSYSWLQRDLTMLILALPAVYLVSALGEEVIYRGFLITRLSELSNSSRRSMAAFIMVFSAVIFGLIHFSWGLMGIVQTTCMGLALAASYLLLKRNLWPLILAHGYMDSVLLVQIYLSPGQSAG